jgi:hypothetical protein
VGVRLFRQYTPSGRALTAALGRVGHRARRKSCLGAGRLGQPSLRSQLPPISFHGAIVHISQPLVRMIEMERAGVVGQVGVSLLPGLMGSGPTLIRGGVVPILRCPPGVPNDRSPGQAGSVTPRRTGLSVPRRCTCRSDPTCRQSAFKNPAPESAERVHEALVGRASGSKRCAVCRARAMRRTAFPAPTRPTARTCPRRDLLP